MTIYRSQIEMYRTVQCVASIHTHTHMYKTGQNQPDRRINFDVYNCGSISVPGDKVQELANRNKG